jgi:hypothetical protein
LPAAVPRTLPRGRLSRAAVFASAATLAACGGKKDDKPKEQPGSAVVAPAEAPSDAPPPMPADASAPEDALADAAGAADAAADAGTDAGVHKHQLDKRHIKVNHHINAKPYGAPPARRRVV